MYLLLHFNILSSVEKEYLQSHFNSVHELRQTFSGFWAEAASSSTFLSSSPAIIVAQRLHTPIVEASFSHDSPFESQRETPKMHAIWLLDNSVRERAGPRPRSGGSSIVDRFGDDPPRSWSFQKLSAEASEEKFEKKWRPRGGLRLRPWKLPRCTYNFQVQRVIHIMICRGSPDQQPGPTWAEDED